MNYYDAKFAREKKENPTEWVIVPTGWQDDVRLVQVDMAEMEKRVAAELLRIKDPEFIKFLREQDYGMMP